MRVKLSDVFELQMGKTPDRNDPACWDGAHKWVSIADLTKTEKYITETKERITDRGVDKSGIKPVPAGTVVMSFKLSIGKTAITTEEIYTNEAIMAFIDKGTHEIDTNYIYHLFSGKDWLEGSNKAVLGLTLNKATLSQKTIELPPLAVQKKVVEVLDRMDSLISLRKKQLQKLDDFVKSRFDEMFGDPETNPFGWDKVSIPAVMRDKASNGFFAKREDYVQDGNVSVLGVAYVVNRLYSQTDGLPRTNATAEDIRKYSVKYGDMLFCRSSLVAEGIGKASIVPENTPPNVLFECHVIRLPLDTAKCVPEFMQIQSSMDFFRKQMIAQSKTATMTTIGQDGIMKATIILPSIEKQKEFYNFLKYVDSTKLTVKQGLDKLELLKQSLMQKYFE